MGEERATNTEHYRVKARRLACQYTDCPVYHAGGEQHRGACTSLEAQILALIIEARYDKEWNDR